MYVKNIQAVDTILKCILLPLIIPCTVYGMEAHGYGYGQSHSSYPVIVQNPGSFNSGINPGTANCSRFHEIDKIVQPGLTTVNVVHFLDEPMIAAYGIDNKNEALAFWYTFNLNNNSYQQSGIETCVIRNAEIRTFDDIQRKDKYFGVITAGNLHNLPIETNATSKPPSNGNLLLGSQGPDKLSVAAVVILDTSSELLLFSYYQLLPAQNVGKAIVFKLVTRTNSTQDCVLFSISINNTLEARIYCFRPLDFQSDDEAVHEFQTISVNEFPLLTTLLVGKTTLVVMVDSDKRIQTMMKPAQVNLDVANVLTHEQGHGSFVNTQQIRMPHIVTVDSVLTAGDIPFLALGSRPDHSVRVDGQTCTGLVSIYLYDKQKGMFELNQSLHVKNLVQIRFLLVVETGEVLLFALSSEADNNISIYSLKGAKGWIFLCSVTVPQASSSIETVAIFDQGQHRAHLIAVTPAGATVIAV